MALDEGVIGARLAVLGENLQILAPLAALDVDTFISDPRNYGAAERFLHLAIEAVFDIGTHCIAGLGLRRPSTYSDVIPTLLQAKVIRQETADALHGLAGFRNLLVHDYTRVDHARVHAFLQTRVDSLRQFAADVAAFVPSTTGDA